MDGYFKNLKGIVHFYNSRDTLARCQPNNPGEGTSCWPAPETTANMNTRFIGRLGLTDAEEDAIVAFLRTLSDGWTPQ
jgi:cytochrome c peroxidase